MQLLTKLTIRLQTLTEATNTLDWKSPNSPNYDRQWAEDALFHTIGPLMDNPRWSERWSSPSEPVPGFVPGGPAPNWTPEEIVFAMAGDPKLAFRPGAFDNPRSPAYGNKGGAPLWRTARRIARQYKRDNNQDFISDLYSNGFIPLVRMMQPGFDEGRSPFISYAIANIESAMRNGTGTTRQNIRATGGLSSDSGLKGLESLLAAKTPDEALEIGDQIRGKYQSGRSHDKHQDNPFGPHSSAVHQISKKYAQALAKGDKGEIDTVRSEIEQLIGEIKDESQILGAATGVGQAISTPDRVSSVRVGSMDAPTDDAVSGSMAGNIPSYEEPEETGRGINRETIFNVLDIALAHDLTKWLAGDEELMMFAKKMGLKKDTLSKITANEFRYLIRSLGPLGSEYPGKGKPRSGVNIPRDAKDWWKPLEDPELEPLSKGGLWHSIWTRNGYNEMGPTEIAREMTEEVKEFEKLNIPTARKAKIKARIEEVVSKVAVSNAMQSALLKLKVILYAERESLGLEESLKQDLRNHGQVLLEDYDPIDRRLFCEAMHLMINKVSRSLLTETPEEEPTIPTCIQWSSVT